MWCFKNGDKIIGWQIVTWLHGFKNDDMVLKVVLKMVLKMVTWF